MNTTTLTTSTTIPKMDLSLLKDLAKRFGWTINNTTSNKSVFEEELHESALKKQQASKGYNSVEETTTIVSEPLFGPASIEEAVSRVQDAEKEYALNGRGTTLKDFMAELKDEQLW